MSNGYLVEGFTERVLAATARLKDRIDELEVKLQEGKHMPDLTEIENAIASLQTDVSNLATVATTGSYTDLSDKPTIPLPGVDFVPLPGGTFTGTVKGTRIVVGEGSGSVALTVNDGAGHANVCFNHAGGIPDSNGSSARIISNVDDTAAALQIYLYSNVVAGIVPQDFFLYAFTRSNFYTIPGGASDLGRPNYTFRNLYLTNAPVVSSDEREKFNRSSLSPAELRTAERILAISYTRAEDPQKHFGVSAQAVAQAFREEGLDPQDYALNVNEDASLGVRYEELYVLLLASVRGFLERHRTEIDELKLRIQSLEET